MAMDPKNEQVSFDYHALFAQAGEAIFIHELPSGKVVDLNEAAVKMFGYERDELIGTKNDKIFISQAPFSATAAMRVMRTLQKGQTLCKEWLVQKVDRSTFLTEIIARKFESGERTYVVVYARDISRRKEVQEQYERLFNVSGAMVCIADLKTGKYIKLSPAFTEVLGYSEKELMAKPMTSFIHPDDRKRTEALIGEMLERSVPVMQFENRYLCKDGSEKWLSWKARAIHDEGIAVAMAYDITDRKQAEIERELALESHRQERDKMATIVEQMGDGLLVIDRSGTVELINKMGALLIGRSRQKVIGKHYSKMLKMVFEKNRKPADGFIQLMFEKGNRRQLTNHALLLLPDGEELPIAVSAAPQTDAEGKVIGGVIVFRDVSEEREIDRLKTEFVSVATHQLHTPLTGIKWFIEMLLTGRGGKLLDRQKEYIEHIQESNERMIKLINNLLNVSKIESGTPFIVQKEHLDLMEMVRKAIADNIEAANDQRVRVKKCKHAPKRFMVSADRNKLQMAINNLLNNAIRFSHPGDEVTFGCEPLTKTANTATIYIRDQGIGIPKKEQAHIFEKFFRASNALTHAPEGTGLGLYVAKAVIEGHGGALTFESKKGKGTTFYIHLPLTREG
ncbi:PAS domain S-box protein [Candidatus Uhrbacteria bacterium]|nr:PAS domain S-box protein [Candidatus Uhrbacteria bacterium]MBD3283952.1 PAS domain S-box protein [Candidatus Uhrbacteria bacterium]